MQQPKFYMATDDQALAHLQKQLNVIGLDLLQPPVKARSEILSIIAEPEN